MRDANAGPELSPVRPVAGFGPGRSLPSRGPDMFGPLRTGSSSAYEFAKVHSIYKYMSMLYVHLQFHKKISFGCILFCVKYTG